MKENIDFNSIADPGDVRFIHKNLDRMCSSYPGKCVLIVNAAVARVFDHIGDAWHYLRDELEIEKYVLVDLSTGMAYARKYQANSKDN